MTTIWHEGANRTDITKLTKRKKKEAKKKEKLIMAIGLYEEQDNL